jgi:ubiquinone/menaquinone biosynthesis C-methylase UbiE
VTDDAQAVSVKSCCAGFYELPLVSMLLGDSLHPGGPALTRKLAEATTVGRGTRVLDVACGRGESGRVLAAHLGCQVVGLDYSAVNAGRARTLTAEAGLTERAQFIAGDAEQLPFRDGSFDVVFSECSLCTFPDLARALAEVRRVLRPGGRVGISDVVLNEPVPAALQELLGHVLCITGAHSTEGYQAGLRSAGFTTIRTRDVSDVLAEMIARIERRVSTLDGLAGVEQLEQVDGLRHAGPKIAAAREFVACGGIGYALFSARKPRDGSADV